MKTLITITLLLLSFFTSFCQIPEIPNFKAVKVQKFAGAPARSSAIITSNISFWILPNAEITALDYYDKFVKVIHGKDTVYVFSDNFKENPEVQEQIDMILKAERNKLLYYEKIKELEIRYKDSVRKAEGIEVMLQENEKVRNKAKKILEKYNTLGSPMAFIDASVSYNSIGIPEANLSAFNISKNDIDAFEVSILCYDNYNRPVNHYLHRTNTYKGISQEFVEPGNEVSGTWTLYGYDNTTKVTFILRSVHYKNKGAWFPKNKISIKSE